MHTVFDVFRADLDKMVVTWQPMLDELWKEIKTIPDKDARLPLIIEYNRFKDIVREMEWLRTDHTAVTRYAKSIAAIKCELHMSRNHESIGDDIMFLVNDIEKLLDQNSTRMCYICISIRKVIQCLKNGDEVVPAKRREEIISKLNRCIARRNESVMIPQHGIILQLRKDKEFIHCISVIYHVQCSNCRHTMQVIGNSECDVFAPVRCHKCKCYELNKSNLRPHDSMKHESTREKKCVIQ